MAVRRTMLIINGALTVCFVAFFAYTFVARRHLDSLARDFVTAKTQKYADPVVAAADGALNSDLVRKLLNDEHIAAFEHEIAKYHRNPPEYIAELTGKRAAAAMRNFNNPVLAKIAEWKDNVRAYYNKVLGRLVWDLRIFAGSNLIAAVIATGLAFRATGEEGKRTAWISFLLFAALLYCAYLYVDGFSFFRILFNSYLGWWYPALLIVAFIELYLRYGRVTENQA